MTTITIAPVTLTERQREILFKMSGSYMIWSPSYAKLLMLVEVDQRTGEATDNGPEFISRQDFDALAQSELITLVDNRKFLTGDNLVYGITNAGFDFIQRDINASAKPEPAPPGLRGDPAAVAYPKELAGLVFIQYSDDSETISPISDTRLEARQHIINEIYRDAIEHKHNDVYIKDFAIWLVCKVCAGTGHINKTTGIPARWIPGKNGAETRIDRRSVGALDKCEACASFGAVKRIV